MIQPIPVKGVLAAFFILLLLPALAQSSSAPASSIPSIAGESASFGPRELAQSFRNPPAPYRDMPFWGWNGALDRPEVVKQVDDFKRMGFGGFFMHSRTGLATPYLSPAWFAMVNAASDRAKSDGMEAWLYDEDRWPSGYAGGFVTRDPKYRMRFLSMHEMSPERFRWTADLVAAFACKVGGTSVEGCTRLTQGADEAAAQGKSVLTFQVELMDPDSAYNGYTYADTLNREATERFLDLTHEQYKQHSGSRLGEEIPGIFADEPQRGPVFNCFSLSNANCHRMAPWTDGLPAAFRQRFGYDLIDKLPDLFLYRNGESVSPVKWQYMELLQSMFVDNWERPIEEWCRRNRLIFTGHALHEDSLTAQAAPQGSMLRYYEYEDYPGVDVLSEFDRNYWLAKQVASVAHQLNKPRTVSETYGGTGWQSTFESYKWISDWQAIFGINFRVLHIAWYTMAGEAKRDYPASMSFQSAWWKDYKYLADYYARLNLLLTQGQPVRNLLVVDPVESLWAQVGVGWADGLSPKLAAIQQLETAYAQIFNWLVQAHLDFDYGGEAMLASLGKVGKDSNGAYLEIGTARYRAVVVPKMTTIRSSTLALLQQFHAEGGSVIFAGPAPAFVDAKADNAATRMAAAAISAPFSEEALVAAVRRASPPPLSVLQANGADARDVFYQLRVDGSQKILALMSMRREQPQMGVRVSLAGTGHIVEWDCRSGRRFQIAAMESGGRLSWTADFPPAGEHVYVVERTLEALPALPQYTQISSTAVAGPFSYRLSEPNVAVLDRASYSLNGEAWSKPEEVLKIDKAVRETLHLPLRSGSMVQPWFTRQFGPVPSGEGMLKMRFSFQVDRLPADGLKLGLEQPGNFSVTLNGSPIDTKAPSGSWVDPAIRTVAIAKSALKIGENSLLLTARFRYDVDLENLFLLGNFGVRLNGPEETLTALPDKVRPKDLTNQGLPFYSGEIVYKVPVHAALSPGERLFIETPHFGAAYMKLSTGSSAEGMIAWQPYRAALTPEDLQRGFIELDAALTRRNSFGPLHLAPKNAVAYGPDQFRSEGASWSSDYQLYPSGLLAAPELAVYREY